jgi:predicted DNA-binding transcriptional regulator AlpA
MRDKLLKVNEVAELLDLKPARVYELCRLDKGFPFILIGKRQYRWDLDSLLKWCERGGNRASRVSKNEE